MESLVIDCTTKEETRVVYTTEQVAEANVDLESGQAERNKWESDKIAKAELLAKLGITADEAKLLLS